MHEKVLTDGSPEAYKEWATRYEDDSMQLGYSGHTSVVKKWQEYHCRENRNGFVSKISHKVFDAGCGTGFVGHELASLTPSFHSTIELYGGDLSPDMLAIAEKKNLYKELKVVNLKERLLYPEECFTSILCAGVFVQGHCGAESLKNIIRVLKRNCFFIATIRMSFYEENKEAWMKAINDCNCQLMEETKMPYRLDVQAIVLVIKKC